MKKETKKKTRRGNNKPMQIQIDIKRNKLPSKIKSKELTPGIKRFLTALVVSMVKKDLNLKGNALGTHCVPKEGD